MKNKTAEEVLKNEFGIGQNIDNDNIGFSVNGDTGNWKKIINAMEEYASQFKPVEVSIPSEDKIKDLSLIFADECEKMGYSRHVAYDNYRMGLIKMRDLWLSSQPQEDKWVSVEERLPEKEKKILLYCEPIGEITGYYWGANHKSVPHKNCNGWSIMGVTHWTELPPSPPKVASIKEKGE